MSSRCATLYVLFLWVLFTLGSLCQTPRSNDHRTCSAASGLRTLCFERNDLQHGKMKYFEICEITPNIRCSNCMTHWPKGLVYCTHGTCLRPSDKVRKLNSDRYDVLSIPNYVIKKGPSHGARHGNTERHRIHAAHVSCKKAEKKACTTTLDRFLKCLIYRRSKMDIGWTEDHSARLDEIAAEDHSYIATASERTRRENTLVLVLNSSGPNGPMSQREDQQEAMRIKEPLYQEPGHANPRLRPRGASSITTRPSIRLARRRI